MDVCARTDRFTFYAVAIMSFLESSVPTFVDNLNVIFKDDKALMQWLAQTWLPEELEHGKQGKAFVTETWPEFDWDGAYREFHELYEPRCSYKVLRPSLAMEALCRCVTETEATMFYRCLGSYTRCQKLKALMKKISADETRHYRVFRCIYEKYDSIENNSTLTKLRMILFRSELARDEDIKLAFLPLNDYWNSKPPFEMHDFSGFLANVKVVIIDHFPVVAAKRMLFKPIKKKGLVNKILLLLMEVLLKSHYLGLVAQFANNKNAPAGTNSPECVLD